MKLKVPATNLSYVILCVKYMLDGEECACNMHMLNDNKQNEVEIDTPDGGVVTTVTMNEVTDAQKVVSIQVLYDASDPTVGQDYQSESEPKPEPKPEPAKEVLDVKTKHEPAKEVLDVIREKKPADSNVKVEAKAEAKVEKKAEKKEDHASKSGVSKAQTKKATKASKASKGKEKEEK